MLTGALGNDCEMREVGKRKAINFNIAVNQDYKNSDGKKVEKTEWVKAVIWKNLDQSTKISDFLKKGQKVYIEELLPAKAMKARMGALNHPWW
jgi:single-strand DNA-binding protein